MPVRIDPSGRELGRLVRIAPDGDTGRYSRPPPAFIAMSSQSHLRWSVPADGPTTGMGTDKVMWARGYRGHTDEGREARVRNAAHDEAKRTYPRTCSPRMRHHLLLGDVHLKVAIEGRRAQSPPRRWNYSHSPSSATTFGCAAQRFQGIAIRATRRDTVSDLYTGSWRAAPAEEPPGARDPAAALGL